LASIAATASVVVTVVVDAASAVGVVVFSSCNADAFRFGAAFFAGAFCFAAVVAVVVVSSGAVVAAVVVVATVVVAAAAAFFFVAG
jgi:hypothetical protein